MSGVELRELPTTGGAPPPPPAGRPDAPGNSTSRPLKPKSAINARSSITFHRNASSASGPRTSTLAKPGKKGTGKPKVPKAKLTSKETSKHREAFTR